MKEEVFTFIVGGKAGEGVRKAGSVTARLFASMGRQVFNMDDYGSLIKGGHNFSVVSTAKRKITSHYINADLVVAPDKRSYDIHKGHLSERGIMVYNYDTVGEAEGVGVPLTTEAKKYPKPDLRIGVGAVATVAAVIGSDKEALRNLIKSEYPRDIENNIAYAMTIYDIVYPKIGNKFQLQRGDKERPIVTGNEAIALGAAAGGLDIYYAYPMTPSSSILHYLAAHDKELGVTAVHPENEIAVMNMAIGSAFAGAKTMVGSSGGGFALMQEAFSLAGMVEAPLLCYLGSRPGPSTGVPTHTAQGDLNFALHQGHGEFARIVASPGSMEEAFYLTAEMLDLVWRFQTPGIILTDKHMAESRVTVDIDAKKTRWPETATHSGGEYKRYLDTENGVSPLLFPPSKELIKWDSYEHDEMGVTTEDPSMIAKMQEKRNRKKKAVADYLTNMHTVNVYGNTGPVILTYGSTTMSVLEALRCREIEAMVVQPVYLEPLPVWELEKYKENSVIVVELSCAGQFASLLAEKVGIQPKAVIKKYDGRPFDPVELASRIKEVV
ncbi:MAG: 2-oxoacid:ferredoxin oxidoreductase subunit alpha [candidate division Zixibacteria bacterium SM1_73]|nr:MAG: 2-oxoacid:ferredoxin oxidoreductase subunit alpha [candidate division Zixibacteria bacterium SM1_73]